MRGRVQNFFILLLVFGLTACGGTELVTSGTLTVELIGGGGGQITAPGIDCPGTCETEVELTQAQVSTVLGGKKEVKVNVAAGSGDEFLVWLGWTSSEDCGENNDCTVVFESICGVAMLPPACSVNSINDIDLRALVVEEGSIIDWDWGSGDACVLYNSGEARCWEHSGGYRNFERADPPALVDPVAISVYSDYACVKDQNGVHCWSDDEVVREPGVEFGLPAIEQVEVISNAGCALHASSVSCWLKLTNSLYTGLLDAPQLTSPSNMRRETNQVCVDDVTGAGSMEKVCWYWSRVNEDPVVTRTPQ